MAEDATAEVPVDINDQNKYIIWLLDRIKNTGDDLERVVSLPYFSCDDCPWGAKTREPYADIRNDTTEAHYICPVLGSDVWGENPICGKHQTSLLKSFLQDNSGWHAHERARIAKEAEEKAKVARRLSLQASAVSKLTAEEIEALGLQYVASVAKASGGSV